MAIHTFAAIYIGSYEVSLKIFELSAKKKIRDIDYVRSRIELGADAYSKGSIGYELVEALCDTLREFAQIMKEYRVDAYEAYASAVLRDVDNELFYPGSDQAAHRSDRTCVEQLGAPFYQLQVGGDA